MDGVAPVGGERPARVELERFARRLHLDLTGRPAPDSFLTEAVSELEGAEAGAGGAASARAALADRLIESEDFAEILVDELGNRVFSGEDPEGLYGVLCEDARGEEECSACGEAPEGGDACAGCNCAPVVAVASDRELVRRAAADLASGTATAEVERRFASSQALQVDAEPPALADLLFQIFLGRPAEADEQTNAEAMIIGSLIPGSPAGLLFHRHGADYDDLVDILFSSEVYREAAVDSVFARYLGRPAGLAEIAHFSAELDPGRPDVRSVIRAVVSSQEYFEQ